MHKETEVRICDLANQIRNMAPVIIFINGKKVWSDDVDLTLATSREEENTLLRQNMEQLRNVLYREDLVWEISFHIVHHHHSAVYIKTL